MSKKSILDDPKWAEFSKLQDEASKEYEKECDNYWENLSYEDQLKAFYSVVKRIHKGDLVDNGSYRYVLYGVFEFGPEAYSIGKECGYMVLHNAIIRNE